MVMIYIINAYSGVSRTIDSRLPAMAANEVMSDSVDINVKIVMTKLTGITILRRICTTCLNECAPEIRTQAAHISKRIISEG